MGHAGIEKKIVKSKLCDDRRFFLKKSRAATCFLSILYISLRTATLSSSPTFLASLNTMGSTGMFPERSTPSNAQMRANLLKAVEVAHVASKNGKHPFGSVLVGPDNRTVLLEQGNVNTLNHAESTLCRSACDKYTPEYLWQCTLYTNFEPCCMCAGSIYWANVGRVVYGLSEHALLELTGDHQENMTLNMPCRNVFSSGQKAVEVIGPFADTESDTELRDAILKDHIFFWK